MNAAGYLARLALTGARALALIAADRLLGPAEDMTRPDTRPPCPTCGERLA